MKKNKLDIRIPIREQEEMFYEGKERTFDTPHGRLRVTPHPEDVVKKKLTNEQKAIKIIDRFLETHHDQGRLQIQRSGLSARNLYNRIAPLIETKMYVGMDPASVGFDGVYVATEKHIKRCRRRRWKTSPDGERLLPSDRRRGIGRREKETKYGIVPSYGRRWGKDRRK